MSLRGAYAIYLLRMLRDWHRSEYHSNRILDAKVDAFLAEASMSEDNAIITLTDTEAVSLRDAIRAENTTREQHELATLRARIAALEAGSARRAVFETIADAHNFDATDSYEFDFQARSLRRKKGDSNGAAS